MNRENHPRYRLHLSVAVAAALAGALLLSLRNRGEQSAPPRNSEIRTAARQDAGVHPLRIDHLSDERSSRPHPLDAKRDDPAAARRGEEIWAPFGTPSEEEDAAILARSNAAPAAKNVPLGALESIVLDLEDEIQEKGGLYAYNSRVYGANLEAGWVEFATNHLLRIGSPTLSYALKEIRVGDEVVARGGAAQPKVRPDRRAVFYERGGIEEEYTLRPEALEQSFVVRELPKGRGAITITGVVSSNLSLPEDGTKGERLAFTYKGKEMIAVSHAVAIDAAGRKQPLELAWKSGELILSVPADWVKEATLPITVDPLVGSPFSVFSTTDPNTNYTVGNAWPVRMTDAAYSPTNATWFVVWTQRWGTGGSNGFDYDVRAQRVTATGTLVGGVVGIDTSTGGAYEPSISYSSGSPFDRYLIAYRFDPSNNLSDTDQRITGKIHGGDGVFVTLNPFTIEDPTGQDMAPTSAFDGTNWYVSYTNKVSASNYDVRGRFVSTAGSPGTSASPDTTTGDSAYMSSVSYANGAYMIVWNKGTTSSGTISARTMLPAGTFPTSITTVEPNTNGPREADLSGGGTKFLIVWRNNSNQSISGRTADAGTGSTITFPTSMFTIQTSSASARSTPRAAYSTTSSSWFTLWADAATNGTDITGAKVTSAGVVSPVEQISSDASWEWRPELAWNSATNEMLLIYNFGSGSPSFAVRGQRYSMAAGSPPPAPANFRGTAQTTTSILWEWDNVAGETGYEVRDASQAVKGTVGADVLAFTESTGLTENASFSRHVNAVGGAGSSPDSNAVARLTKVHAPLAADFALTAVSFSQIDVAVTPPPNSTAGSTGCQIERSPDGSTGWVTIKAFSAVYSFSDTGRSPATTYFYRITFRNGDAVATATSPNNSATTPPTIPAAPAGFSGSAQSTTSILWSWSDVAGETSFDVHDASHAVKGTAGANILSLTESTLSENTSYLRHVHAVNAAGSSPSSNSATTYTKVHDPVAGDFAVMAASTSQIDITVTAPPNSASGSTACEIDRSPDGSSGWVTIKTFAVAGYTFSDTGRASSTAYFYRFRYRNGDALSTVDSPVKSATTPPVPIPAGLTGTAQSTSSILWSWSNVPGETGFEVRDAAQVVKGSVGVDVLSFTETTGLTENATVGRHVNAKNGTAASGDSNTATTFTKVHDPAAGDFTATPVSPTQIDVVVTAPPNSAAGLTAAEIDRSPDGSTNWVTIKTFAVAGYTFSDTGRVVGVPNYYRFRYRNGDAIVTADSPVKSATTGTSLAPPTGLGATPGDAQVALSWTASAGATSYNVKRGTVNGGPYPTVFSGITATSYMDTGLSNGTPYFYVVTAQNGTGESGNSNQASATPTAGAPPPPTDLLAAATGTTATLTWVASSGAATYNVKRATATGGPYSDVPGGTGIASTSFTDTGLSVGVTYYYVVTATNLNGTSGNSNESRAKVLPVPTGVSATVGDGFVNLSWNIVPEATSYLISRSTSAGGPFVQLVRNFTNAFSDTGVFDGTTYFYSVQSAGGIADVSDYSVPVSATPQPSGQASVLFVVGTSPIPSGTGDEAVSSRLTALGYAVVVKPAAGAGAATTGDASGKALVVISSTANAGDVGTKFTNVPVPVLTWQATLLNALGMIEFNQPNTDYGTIANQTQLAVYDSNSPITSALTSLPQPVDVSTASTYSWGRFTGGWVVVGATVPNDLDKGLIATFEAGRPMPGLDPAPARRAFCFLSSDTALALNSTGQSLLDTTIQWAAGAPEQLQGVWASVGDGQITLHWEATSGATNFQIQQASSPSGLFTTIATGVTGTQFTVGNLNNGTPYSFRVVGFNASGQGIPSNVVTASPNPVAATVALTGTRFLRLRLANDSVDVWNSHLFTALVHVNGAAADPSTISPDPDFGTAAWSIEGPVVIAANPAQTVGSCKVVSKDDPMVGGKGPQGLAKLTYHARVNVGTPGAPSYIPASASCTIKVVPRYRLVLRFHFPNDGPGKRTQWTSKGYPHLFDDDPDTNNLRFDDRSNLAKDFVRGLNGVGGIPNRWNQACLDVYGTEGPEAPHIVNDIDEKIGNGEGIWQGNSLKVSFAGMDAVQALNDNMNHPGVINVYFVSSFTDDDLLAFSAGKPEPGEYSPYIVLPDKCIPDDPKYAFAHELGHTLYLKESYDVPNKFYRPHILGTVNNLEGIFGVDNSLPYYLMHGIQSQRRTDCLVTEGEANEVRKKAESLKVGTGNLLQSHD